MPKRRFLEYAVSVLLVLSAVAFTELSEPWVFRQTLFVFLGVVVLATLYGGLGPGLLGLVLAAVATALVVLRPLNDFRIEEGGVRWILFQLLALVMVVITASRRRAMDRLRAGGERLRLALEVARTGIWDYSRVTGELWTSPGLNTMLGLHEDQPLTYPQFLELIHPDDRDLFTQALERIFADRVDYEVDFRALRPDGSVRYLAMRGRTYIAVSGMQRFVGAVTDKAATPSVTLAARQSLRHSAEPIATQA